MKKIKQYKNFFVNLIFPAFIFGSITGILTAVLVTLYKLCAKHIIRFSEKGYIFLLDRPYIIPIVVIGLFLVAVLCAFIYKKLPNLRGGGIPTSIGILRGIIKFKWLVGVIGIFLLSLGNFLIGVPLGNEGPSVQMGTCIGRGSVGFFAKKHKAWDRYSMTGGACAGFSVATGAPISGIMFAVEEAHQRISPMIIIVSSVSVMFARVTTEILSPLLGVSVELFPSLKIPKLQISSVWIPIVVGIVIGVFAVIFLYYYKLIYRVLNVKLKKIPHKYKIFTVLLLTVVFGLISFNFVSTGHHLTETVLTNAKTAFYMLALILFVRSTLTLLANSNSMTGGLFLPIMALGAVLSSILGKGMINLGLNPDLYTVVVVLGITACISGMMKMPLTAIIFAIEALSCYENILYVIIVAAVSYVITEIFRAESINESVIERRIHELNGNKEHRVFDTFVTVKKDSFAVGKQIRDIFWPNSLTVLAVKHDETREHEVDMYGGKAIREGDVLHVRYSTYDEEQTKDELYAIVGLQE